MTKVIGEYDDRNVSLLAVDQYFRWLHWSGERIGREEEPSLFAQIAQGNTEARDRVGESFQGLVITIAQRYQRVAHTMELLDLIQEGNLGLLKAIALAAQNGQTQGFTGLASRCIANAICEALFRRDRGVHLSDELRKDMRRMRRTEHELHTRLGREPLLCELAAALHMREGEVRQLLVWWQRQEVASLQEVFHEQDEEGQDRHFLLAVYSSGLGQQEEQERVLLVLRESGSAVYLRAQRVFEAIRQAFESVLTERQKLTLQLLYGLGAYDGGCCSRQEVAAHIGMTYESIRYYEQEAYKRLRRALAPVIEKTEVAS